MWPNYWTTSVKLLMNLWAFSGKKSKENLEKCEIFKGECLVIQKFCASDEILPGFCAEKTEICCKKISTDRKTFGPIPSTKFYERVPNFQSVPISMPKDAGSSTIAPSTSKILVSLRY